MQLVSAPASLSILDENMRIKQALKEEHESSHGESLNQEDKESPYVMSGSTIYRYIEPSPLHISQFELNTYLQTAHSIVLLQVLQYFGELLSHTQTIAIELTYKNLFLHIYRKM